MRRGRLALALLLSVSCGDPVPVADPATQPQDVKVIATHTRAELVEGSAAVMSHTQPGILFTINDSGHEPVLYALDTAGTDRGAWLIEQARNRDWEAASLGPCPAATAPRACLTIGDVGDNDARRAEVRLVRVAEPEAMAPGASGTLRGQVLVMHYEDGPHDVEALYVGPGGDTFLITKRRLLDARGTPRPALVFRVPATAWSDSTVVAALVDSLPIVPGSASGRTVTDASLSADARFLAVRTYTEIFVFATDSTTGSVRHDVAPARCVIGRIEDGAGEGITWLQDRRALLLTREGADAPMLTMRCPLPTP